MLGFMVLAHVILSLAANAIAYHQNIPLQSAASNAQIRFALENKYDNTGPGAEKQQIAYNIYKTLDDALIAYLDDPDTELSPSDRSKAINRLTQMTTNGDQNQGNHEVQRYYPKTVEEYTGYEQPKPKPQFVNNIPATQYEITHTNGLYRDRDDAARYKLRRVQLVRGNPLSLAHYSRDSALQNDHEAFYAHPKYSFSYGRAVSIQKLLFSVWNL
ncbi:ABC transporter, ATP-binding protein [Operophtera brumata]|uniref:ABC transporter, ATP-binding protein n=1 Tax=Operophtera brumata TaxID=104452 RepID=A0A0L7LSJ7_OPEBR|nr:ABC transporter, ATP-binding protein [Operophtera brumata]